MNIYRFSFLFIVPFALNGCASEKDECGQVNADYLAYNKPISIAPTGYGSILDEADVKKINNCYNRFRHEYDFDGAKIINALKEGDGYNVVLEINGVNDIYILFLLDKQKQIIDAYEYSALNPKH